MLFGARSRLGALPVLPALDAASTLAADGAVASFELTLQQILTLSDGAVLRYEPAPLGAEAETLGAAGMGLRQAGWLPWLRRENEVTASWVDRPGQLACRDAN